MAKKAVPSTVPDKDRRFRKFCILLYQDTESYDTAEILDFIMGNIMTWNYILHDMDEKEYKSDEFPDDYEEGDGIHKKAHIHVVVRTKNGHTLTAFAKLLGIDSRFIQVCTSYRSAVRYLIHADDSDKYQYNMLDICSNDPVLQAYFPRYKPTEAEIISQYVEMIKFGAIMPELIRFAIDSETWGYFRLNYTIIKDILNNNYFRKT